MSCVDFICRYLLIEMWLYFIFFKLVHSNSYLLFVGFTLCSVRVSLYLLTQNFNNGPFKTRVVWYSVTFCFKENMLLCLVSYRLTLFFVLQASLVQIENVPLILWFSFLPGVGISVPAAAPVQPAPQAPTLQAAPQTANMQPQHQQLLMKQQQAAAFTSTQSTQQVGIWMQPGWSLCSLNLCLCNTIKINPEHEFWKSALFSSFL